MDKYDTLEYSHMKAITVSVRLWIYLCALNMPIGSQTSAVVTQHLTSCRRFPLNLTNFDQISKFWPVNLVESWSEFFKISEFRPTSTDADALGPHSANTADAFGPATVDADALFKASANVWHLGFSLHWCQRLVSSLHWCRHLGSSLRRCRRLMSSLCLSRCRRLVSTASDDADALI